MGELYDDRRQEPRFATSGTYYLQSGSRGTSGRIFDLSVNGAMLEKLATQPMESGKRVNVVLHFPGQPEFVADVLVQHIAEERVGVEFYDMSPEHFSTLATLIEHHQRSR
ncbi:PilZ domain-containing protein [Tahibacter amnicola]|uniref:PilZ domain-containing protein n=1 Tax=Tahibacter amnicola TaxID=2976241 RepID=A0ABY6BKZ2_9GAMM|nr:PilZ domain-containing protein [Tahibacter amnicola]UXI69055.1 PilZ domain-containing protein [Tahibacter amnicola]